MPMVNDEPPPYRHSQPSLFPHRQEPLRQLGRSDQNGLHGGLFVNRTEALKFALFENGNRPQAVIMVPGVLELDMSPRISAASRAA